MFNDHQPELEVPQATLKLWQEVVDLLASLGEVPAALIMHLAQADIEVQVASRSAGNPYQPGDHEHFEGSGLYCETVIKRQQRLLVANALNDPEWRTNPDIKLNMISYLGLPLNLPDGRPFGTICVLDQKSNAYSETYISLLTKLRDLIQADIELMYINQALGDHNRHLVDYLGEIQAFRGLVTICAGCKSIKDADGKWQPIEQYLIKHPLADFSHSLCPTCQSKLYPPMEL